MNEEDSIYLQERMTAIILWKNFQALQIRLSLVCPAMHRKIIISYIVEDCRAAGIYITAVYECSNCIIFWIFILLLDLQYRTTEHWQRTFIHVVLDNRQERFYTHQLWWCYHICFKQRYQFAILWISSIKSICDKNIFASNSSLQILTSMPWKYNVPAKLYYGYRNAASETLPGFFQDKVRYVEEWYAVIYYTVLLMRARNWSSVFTFYRNEMGCISDVEGKLLPFLLFPFILKDRLY